MAIFKYYNKKFREQVSTDEQNLMFNKKARFNRKVFSG